MGTSAVQTAGANRYGNIEKTELEVYVNKNAGDREVEVFEDANTIYVNFKDTKRYYEINEEGNVSNPIIKEEVEYAGDITKNGTCDGSEEKAYEINCIEDLIAFSKSASEGNNYSGKYIKLMRTLDFNSIFSYNDHTTKEYDTYLGGDGTVELKTQLSKNGKGFAPIGNENNWSNMFQGTFDGQGFEIRNIYVNTNISAGLFGKVYSATIKNLGLASGKVISTEGSAGGMVGTWHWGCNIENCYNFADIEGKNDVGGIAGGSHATAITLIRCYNAGVIKGGGSCGGLVGQGNATINLCYNIGEVISNGNAAGILGKSTWSNIVNCYNAATVTTTHNYGNVGGIVGEDYEPATVDNCYNIGDMISTASWCERGVRGIGARVATNCYNLGTITTINAGVRAAIGATTTNQCYYSSNINNNVNVEEGVIDISTKSAQEFVDLLNSYVDENGSWPSGWNQWKIGDDGYPTFE